MEYYCSLARGKKRLDILANGGTINYLDTDLVKRMKEAKNRAEKMDIYQDSLDSAVYWESIMKPIISKVEKEGLNMKNYDIYESMPGLERFCNENDIYWNIKFNEIADTYRFSFVHRPSRETYIKQFSHKEFLSVYRFVIENECIEMLKQNLFSTNGNYDSFSVRKNSGRYPWREDTKMKIKNVIFNDPATIVFWSDGTKTVVKAENEEFDKEKGLAMAVAKKFLGTNKSKSNYMDIFKEWIRE